MYMKCSDNSKSATVYEYFLEATRLYGVPSCAQSDQGKENYMVARFMLQYCGTEQHSMITGSFGTQLKSRKAVERHV